MGFRTTWQDQSVGLKVPLGAKLKVMGIGARIEELLGTHTHVGEKCSEKRVHDILVENLGSRTAANWCCQELIDRGGDY